MTTGLVNMHIDQSIANLGRIPLPGICVDRVPTVQGIYMYQGFAE